MAHAFLIPTREWIGGDEWLLSSSALSRIVTRRRRRMATTFFSIPTPHNNTTLLLSSQRHFTNINNNSWLLHGSTSSASTTRYGHSYKPTITIPLCSSPSTTTTQVAAEPDSKDTSFSGCTACGREEIQNGCNGEGRIQGGIATVPGFGWWPIKAYRPCPGFVASGGRYRRQGQSMDEVASGRGRRAKTSSELKSSKKKQGNLADDLKKV